MKFLFSIEKCHAAWCQKLDNLKVEEILTLFKNNPLKKDKFQKLPLLIPCIQEMYFLDIDINKIDSLKKKLEYLPKYFSKDQFNTFIKETHILDYIVSSPTDPKSLLQLTINTQEWMIDKDGNQLFCNPLIGNLWGKAAKLDDTIWNDF